MTPDERRHGTSKSGWCIDGHHPACTYPPCPCECGHPNRKKAEN
jgi:hypothetical protein